MNSIVCRTGSTLTYSERSQLCDLIKRYYPSAQPSYLAARTTEACDFDIVLIKNQDTVLGANYYKTSKQLTPFSHEYLWVVEFGQALKRQDYRGNIIWRLGNWYSLRNISLLYPFKRGMGICKAVNPKVYENFGKLFPYHYPNVKDQGVDGLVDFMNGYYATPDLNQICQDLVVTVPGLEEDDITEHWQRYYAAKNDAINRLFFDLGIIYTRDNRIYKSDKHLLVSGFRAPLAAHSIFRSKPAFIADYAANNATL